MTRRRATYYDVPRELRYALWTASQRDPELRDLGKLAARVTEIARQTEGANFAAIPRQTMQRLIEPDDSEDLSIPEKKPRRCFFLPWLREALGVKKETKFKTTFRVEEIEMIENAEQLRQLDSQEYANFRALLKQTLEKTVAEKMRQLDLLRMRIDSAKQ